MPVGGKNCLMVLGCYITCIGKALETVMLHAKYVLEYFVNFKRVFSHPNTKNQFLYHKSAVSSCYSSPLIVNLSL